MPEGCYEALSLLDTHTHIKRHNQKFSCLNDLVTRICLPLPKVHTGTLLALNWYLEGKFAQNGSIWFSIDGWDGL
jgi:hypothetical protein